MTLAMLAGQTIAPQAGQVADKWKLYRALCEARLKLGLTDRALSLLNALLTFHPSNELSAEQGLVVFPSNAQLSARAHGMAEQTIRRHLSALVDAGLIARKDSANGKRYARRDGEGTIDEAFGFSLAPLLARAGEIERLAAEVVSERLVLQRIRERFTICRRDVAKLIAAAIDEGAEGNWQAHHAHYRSLVDQLSRKPQPHELAKLLDEMELLRDGVVNHLEMQVKIEILGGNAHQTERHIQNSNTESHSELEPLSEEKQAAKAELLQQPGNRTSAERGAQGEGRAGRSEASRAAAAGLPGARTAGGSGDGGSSAANRLFPLGLVLRACPAIADYGPGGQIGSWRELMAAAVVVRSMLGVSPSAYQEACEAMGPENAATAMACILERANQINSAGGYLRDLTRRARLGEFGLGPMLMALMRANGSGERRSA